MFVLPDADFADDAEERRSFIVFFKISLRSSA